MRFATDIVQYRPDLLLVMHNINDLLVVYSAAVQGRSVDSSYHVKYARKSLTGYVDESDVVLSRLVAFVGDRLARLAPRQPRPVLEGYDIEAGRQIFARNLRSLVGLARANGTQVVLVTMPVARSLARFEDVAKLERGGAIDAFPTHERFLADFDRYNETVREVGRELGAPVIDATRLVPPDDELFADLVHTTTDGVRAMGTAVASKLLGILPPPREAGPEPVRRVEQGRSRPILQPD